MMLYYVTKASLFTNDAPLFTFTRRVGWVLEREVDLFTFTRRVGWVLEREVDLIARQIQ